jgi:hypothetical protein
MAKKQADAEGWGVIAEDDIRMYAFKVIIVNVHHKEA